MGARFCRRCAEVPAARCFCKGSGSWQRPRVIVRLQSSLLLFGTRRCLSPCLLQTRGRLQLRSLAGGHQARRGGRGRSRAGPQPGGEQADGGHAGHAGEHPVPGTPPRRQSRRRRGLGLSRPLRLPPPQPSLITPALVSRSNKVAQTQGARSRCGDELWLGGGGLPPRAPFLSLGGGRGL